MTREEFLIECQKWDFSSNAACLVFSDWLLEHGEVKWANIIRWAVAGTSNKHLDNDMKYRLEVWMGSDKFPVYERWEWWAREVKLETAK